MIVDLPKKRTTMCFGLVVFYLLDRIVSLGYDTYKDAIYNVLHFSDDMDKISEDKDPSVFLIDTAEKSQEHANRVGLLVYH